MGTDPFLHVPAFGTAAWGGPRRGRPQEGRGPCPRHLEPSAPGSDVGPGCRCGRQRIANVGEPSAYPPARSGLCDPGCGEAGRGESGRAANLAHQAVRRTMAAGCTPHPASRPPGGSGTAAGAAEACPRTAGPPFLERRPQQGPTASRRSLRGRAYSHVQRHPGVGLDGSFAPEQGHYRRLLGARHRQASTGPGPKPGVTGVSLPLSISRSFRPVHRQPGKSWSTSDLLPRTSSEAWLSRPTSATGSAGTSTSS